MFWTAGSCGQGRGRAPGRSAWLRAREPIFSETHTEEFCGIQKSTPEPAGPCRPLRPGRWVYEKGAGRAAAGAGNGIDGTCWLPRLRRRPARLPAPRRVRGARLCGCELASPFLAKPIQMSFAGLGNPPQSPPARAPHCAPVGGYMRREKEHAPVGRMSRALKRLGTSPRQPSQAAVGPISYFAAFAWCPTVCRGTDDCGEHHPSTAAALAHPPGVRRGIWEDSAGAREYPMCAEGWAMWVLGGSPDLFKATGGTYRLGTPQG